MSDVQDFSSTLISETGVTATELAMLDLVYGTTYYWRVKALIDADESEWSEVCSFTTKINSFRPFITLWKTDNPGNSGDTQITIPTKGGGYDYDIFWEDVNNDANTGIINDATSNLTIDFGVPGIYWVEITGDFPRIYFEVSSGAEKILSIEQWGDIEWSSMEGAFQFTENLTYNATDVPNLENVTSMNLMFGLAKKFNGEIGDWDVSYITDMGRVFVGAESFNQDISNWDVSNVTNLGGMFFGALVFNQPIGKLSTENVTQIQCSEMLKISTRI